jgi:hypothetical protein
VEGTGCRRATQLGDFMALVRGLLSCEGFVVRRLEVHILATLASEALRRPRGAKRVSKYFHTGERPKVTLSASQLIPSVRHVNFNCHTARCKEAAKGFRSSIYSPSLPPTVLARPYPAKDLLFQHHIQPLPTR